MHSFAGPLRGRIANVPERFSMSCNALGGPEATGRVYPRAHGPDESAVLDRVIFANRIGQQAIK